MPGPPNNPQNIHAVIVILVAACFCAAYWRIVLRVILIVVIALTIYGAVIGIDGATSLMTHHHR
jgi:hypothetical protein